MQKKNNKRKSLIYGLLLSIFGIGLLTNNYYLSKKDYAFNYMNDKLYLKANELPIEDDREDESGVVDDTTEEEQKEEKKETTTPKKQTNNKNNNSKPTSTTSYYKGYLEIPKLNLKKGFVDINSRDNVVDKNITIISGSKYPNVDKGNFIIAGHSGTGPQSYFKDLYKLKTGDTANVYYKNVKYTYKIKKIYNQSKNGKITIKRDYNKTTLTLITCTKDNKKSQTIYIAELQSKKSY